MIARILNCQNYLGSISGAAVFGFAVVFSYCFVAVMAPWLAPFGENEIIGSSYEPWSRAHILGTDNLGRDMLSRLIFGARNTIGLALLATLLAFVIGVPTGLLAAVRGGAADLVMGRVVDVLMAVPPLILALLVLSIVGTSTKSMVLVIAVIESTRVFRVGRSAAVNVVAMDFIEASRLRGESAIWIVWYEILPNTLNPLLADFGLRFCYVFLLISSLSFLGLGIQPPAADWGGMLRDNASLISFGDVTPLLPAAAIAILTIAVNFIVDWVLSKRVER